MKNGKMILVNTCLTIIISIIWCMIATSCGDDSSNSPEASSNRYGEIKEIGYIVGGTNIYSFKDPNTNKVYILVRNGNDSISICPAKGYDE